MRKTIEFVKDKNKRQCWICKKNIVKGSLILKLECEDVYCNSTKNFVHLDCLLNKLKKTKEKFDEIVPKNKIEV